ncbi:molybdopterin molybdotransferase [Barrientosiimonas humi]|uniref:Molybdopterin molybdenumtransferase n=1 Tax=Barrientosiimonas humi TaxID=999931 RepID=A0A542XER7_9MICO|nr:gephyrin-like molybdotransferase Glp [Barrientosiimonas humi]TQL34315.1 molybdopterin molybdotransferase [Barrientosiimonas humi]CAG7574306.1 Molybdopterin molybdenumtransferase 2 [Barrientosiimonas humi]
MASPAPGSSSRASDERGGSGLVPLEEHRAAILRAVRPLPAREVAAVDALGLVLAEPVASRLDLPSFTNSAMDGYAVVAADLAEVPASLPVRGDIRAGATGEQRMAAGECWRIMTGAPVPAGADAIVPVELTDGGTTQVQVREQVEPGNAVRHQGEDLRVGDPLVPAGSLLLAHHLSAIVAAGVETVQAVPRPRLAVLTTGDELVPPGQPLAPGQIVDSNGPMLRALALCADVEVVAVEHVRDDDDLGAVVDRLAESADAVVTSGGVSAGAYEPVKDAYAGGDAVRFVSVAMQPGKPQGFGLVGGRGVPLFALPGNPVSSLVSFQEFVLPALRKLAGRSPELPVLHARVVDGWRSPAGRLQLARVRLARRDGELQVSASGGAGSHILGGLASAQAIAYVPAEQTRVEPGEVLAVRMLPGEIVPDE